MVFHRILDFKAGLDFYLGPFFISNPFCNFLFAKYKALELALMNTGYSDISFVIE
jgi:hypothetical protein